MALGCVIPKTLAPEASVTNALSKKMNVDEADRAIPFVLARRVSKSACPRVKVLVDDFELPPDVNDPAVNLKVDEGVPAFDARVSTAALNVVVSTGWLNVNMIAPTFISNAKVSSLVFGEHKAGMANVNRGL